MNTEPNGGNSLTGLQEYSRISMLFLSDPLQYARQYADTLVQFANSRSMDDGLQRMSFGMAYEALKELNDPDNEDYWYAKGVICERLYHLHHDAGNYEDAIGCCEELLKVEDREEAVYSCPRTPEKARIHVNMGKCYQDISDNVHAVQHFREAVKLILNDETGCAKYGLLDNEYVLSMCLSDFNQGKWEDTRDLCTDVLAILEDIENSMHLEADEKIDAIKLREKIHILLSIACKKSGDKDSALNNKRKAEDLETDVAILLHDCECELDEKYGTHLEEGEDMTQEELEDLKSLVYDVNDNDDCYFYLNALEKWRNPDPDPDSDTILKLAEEYGLQPFSQDED